MAEDPDELPDDERTVLASPRRAHRAGLIDSVPGVSAASADAEPEERTVLSARHLYAAAGPAESPSPASDAEEERTVLSARHLDAAERTVLSARHLDAPPAEDAHAADDADDADDADATVIAERGLPDATIMRPRAVGTGITRGRADTARSATVPRDRPAQAIYRPRADVAAAPVARMPVAPPVAAEVVAPPRRRRTGLLMTVVAGTLLIAGGAIAGILILTAGG